MSQTNGSKLYLHVSLNYARPLTTVSDHSHFTGIEVNSKTLRAVYALTKAKAFGTYSKNNFVVSNAMHELSKMDRWLPLYDLFIDNKTHKVFFVEYKSFRALMYDFLLNDVYGAKTPAGHLL